MASILSKQLKSGQKCLDFKRSSFQIVWTIAITTASPILCPYFLFIRPYGVNIQPSGYYLFGLLTLPHLKLGFRGDRPSRPSPAHSLIKKLTSHASCFPLPTTTHRYLLLPHFVLHLEGRSCYSIWVHTPPYTESSRRICGLWVQFYLPVFSFLFHFLYKF